MKTSKLKNKYDHKFGVYTRSRFEDDEYGFAGEYICKDLGVCFVSVSQYCKTGGYQYYLDLEIIKNNIEYHRQFDCSLLPSYRLAMKKAREFLEELQ